MSERVCQSCGAPLPADAHPHRRACSAACQGAAANANRRQTRRGPEYRAKVRERDERKREAERAAAAKRTAGARRQFDGDLHGGPEHLPGCPAQRVESFTRVVVTRCIDCGAQMVEP